MGGRLAGKVAVVTGAGSGMGAAMVEVFCREGANVIAADISGQQETVAEKVGASCRAVYADVSSSQSVQGMINLAIQEFGRLDVLCNNAGVPGKMAKTADYDEDEFEHVMAINCRGVFLGMKYAIPLMLRTGGGSIINTSSVAAMVTFPTMPAYCASKGAVAMLTKTAAAEYAAEGIRINAILPGPVESGMSRSLPTEFVTAGIKATPMARIGTPTDIANLALFFACDDSLFVTGTLVPADGGYTIL